MAYYIDLQGLSDLEVVCLEQSLKSVGYNPDNKLASRSDCEKTLAVYGVALGDAPAQRNSSDYLYGYPENWVDSTGEDKAATPEQLLEKIAPEWATGLGHVAGGRILYWFNEVKWKRLSNGIEGDFKSSLQILRDNTIFTFNQIALEVQLRAGDYTTRKEIKAYAEEQGITLKQAYQRICDAFVSSGFSEGEGVDFSASYSLLYYGVRSGSCYFSTMDDSFKRHLTPEQIIGAPQEESQEQSETTPEPRLISSFSYKATVGEASMHLEAEDITIEDAIALLQEVDNG